MQLGAVARLNAIAMALAALLISVPAAAQSPIPAPQTIESAVRIGDTVFVETSSGQVRKGRIFAVSATSLELLRGQRKEVISVSEIRRVGIEYADRLRDGVTRGVLSGILVGFVSGVTIAASDCSTPYIQALCSTEGFLMASGFLAGVGAGVGGLVGLVLDKLYLSNREVWRPHVGSVKVEIALVAIRSKFGAGVQIRW